MKILIKQSYSLSETITRLNAISDFPLGIADILPYIAKNELSAYLTIDNLPITLCELNQDEHLAHFAEGASCWFSKNNADGSESWYVGKDRPRKNYTGHELIIDDSDNTKIFNNLSRGSKLTGNELLKIDFSGFYKNSIGVISYEDIDNLIGRLLITATDLQQFEQSLTKNPKTINHNLHQRERVSFLNIMGALKDALIDKGAFQNQAAIIDYLANESDARGLSESNLKAKFAEVNQAEKSN